MILFIYENLYSNIRNFLRLHLYMEPYNLTFKENDKSLATNLRLQLPLKKLMIKFGDKLGYSLRLQLPLIKLT